MTTFCIPGPAGVAARAPLAAWAKQVPCKSTNAKAVMTVRHGVRLGLTRMLMAFLLVTPISMDYPKSIHPS